MSAELEPTENDSSSRRRRLLRFALFAILVVGGIFMAKFLPDARERARRISCASNLVSFGLAFRQYAMDFNGYFPNRDGIAGLEILHKEEYCGDPKAYLCPSSRLKSADHDQPLVSTYEYCGGLKAFQSPPRPLMWDRPGNHQGSCHVLFTDGHVEELRAEHGQLTRARVYKRGQPGNDSSLQPGADLPPAIRRAAGLDAP